jgi:hypothetical protein
MTLDIKYKNFHKKTQPNGNMEAIKLVLDAIKAVS